MPSAARSSAAMSMRFICIIASKARLARARSASPINLISWRGTDGDSRTRPKFSAVRTERGAFTSIFRRGSPAIGLTNAGLFPHTPINLLINLSGRNAHHAAITVTST